MLHGCLVVSHRTTFAFPSFSRPRAPFQFLHVAQARFSTLIVIELMQTSLDSFPFCPSVASVCGTAFHTPCSTIVTARHNAVNRYILRFARTGETDFAASTPPLACSTDFSGYWYVVHNFPLSRIWNLLNQISSTIFSSMTFSVCGSTPLPARLTTASSENRKLYVS